MVKYKVLFISLFLFFIIQSITTGQTFQSVDILQINSNMYQQEYTQGEARIRLISGSTPMYLSVGCQGMPSTGPVVMIINNYYIPSTSVVGSSPWVFSYPFNLDQLATQPHVFPSSLVCYFHISSTPLPLAGPYPSETWVWTKITNLSQITFNNYNYFFQSTPHTIPRVSNPLPIEPGDEITEYAVRNGMYNVDLSNSLNPPSAEWTGDKAACVVAATSNSMMWMKDNYSSFKLPAGWTQRDLMKELGKQMKRRDTTGVWESDMIKGKMDFGEKYMMPFEVKFQDVKNANNIFNTSGNRKARNFNLKDPRGKDLPPTFEFLLKMMKEGEDVEIQYEWFDSVNNRWGAHSVVCSEVYETRAGKRGIRLTHDFNQTDTSIAGLDNTVYQLTSDSDGYMRFNQNGKMRIQSIVAESPLLEFGSLRTAWLNELVVNPYTPNSTSRQGQFLAPYIEIALHSSVTDLEKYKITLYNGDTGLKYLELTLNQFTPGTTSNGLKFYSYTFTGVQINQTHGGIGISYSGSPIDGQFWSYGGVFLGLDGDFTQMWTTEIGSVRPGRAFALAGSGTNWNNFSWTLNNVFTLGSINPDQYYGTGGPSIPVITAPIQGSTQPTTADFTWTDSTAGATFDYMISEDSTFITTFAQETNYNGLTKQITGLQGNKKYYFKIRARNTTGVSAYNQIWFMTGDAPARYTITLNSNPPEGGTTTGSGTFPSGTSDTVKAFPARGYTFVNWTEGATILTNGFAYYFTVTSNRTLTANFQQNPYSISGFVRLPNGAPLAGAKLRFAGASFTDSTTSNADGFYTLAVPAQWSGSVTPSLAGYTFYPEWIGYGSMTGNLTNQNYIAFQGTTQYQSIEGFVRTVTGAPVEGVKMTFAGALMNDSTFTGADGKYFKYVPTNWTGTVTPSKANYSFAPVNRSYSNLMFITSGENYTATQLQTYSISGYVRFASGGALSAVKIAFSGGQTNDSVFTNADGFYTFNVPSGWTGNVQPSKAGYTFYPHHMTLGPITQNLTNQNFVAFQGTTQYLSIEGVVMTATGAPIEGVKLTFAGTTLFDSAFTAQNGSYFKYVPTNWTGTVVPSKPYYSFTPTNRAYVNMTNIMVGQDYTANTVQTYTISGFIKFASGTPLSGVKVGYSGSEINDSVFTNADGFYTLTVPQGWTGVVQPAKSGYTFYPHHYSYTSISQNYTNQNFTIFQGTTQYYSIEGYVRLATGAPVEGVKMTFTDALTAKHAPEEINSVDSVFTGADGKYFKYVPANWNGSVVPSKLFYTFAPVNRNYTNVNNIITGQDYTATYVQTYTISGYIRFTSGAALSGVKLTFSGSQINDSVFTNADGFYTLTVPQGWTGVVQPSKTGYTFYPHHYSYSNVNINFTNQNFVAFQGQIQYFSISGRVSLATGAPLQGVKIAFAGATLNDSTFTGTDGTYFMYVPANWTGTATPSKLNYSFAPPVSNYLNVTEIYTDNNYIATQVTSYTISGFVRYTSGSAFAGVKIAFSGGAVNDSVFTNADGFYTLTVPVAWSGVVQPVKSGFTFYPHHYTYTSISRNYTDQNFIAFQGNIQYYSISGSVNLVTGAPLSGVKLTFTGALMNDSVFSGQDGTYFKYVPAGWTGTVTPSKLYTSFEPVIRSYTNVADIITGQNYIATPLITFTITTIPNPQQGGTTSGGGVYINNQTDTVKAIPNPGWDFVNWTEGSTVVSTNTVYVFVVTANRTLTANFRYNPVLMLRSPAGGEVLYSGSSFSITWQSAGVATINLDFSSDNGASWTPLAASVPASPASWGWTVPSINSTTCKVKIYDPSNTSLASTSNVFTIASVLPPPILISPQSNSVNVHLPVSLLWHRAQGAAKYILEISTDPLFTTSAFADSSVTDTFKIVSTLNSNTKYYWRLKSVTGTSISVNSAIWNFTTIAGVPQAPVLIAPQNNSTGIPTTTLFLWNSIPSILKYRFQVSTDSLFATFFINDSTLTDTFKIVIGLSANTKYYWRVNATNISGTGNWSTVFNFTTVSPSTTLTGTLVYANQQGTRLTNIKIYLIRSDGTKTDSTVTSQDGTFLFNAVPNGFYNVRPDIKLAWGGVSSTDALLIRKYLTGTQVFDTLQIKASDVNSSGSVNSTDALLIRRRMVGDILTFTIGDFVYEYPLLSLSGAPVNITIRVLCAGDVNASYTLTPSAIPEKIKKESEVETK